MDLPYILRYRQGWLVMITGLIALFIYTVFDVNAMFILSDSVLHRKNKPWWTILKEAFLSLRYYVHPQGLFVTLYLGLLGPLIGPAVGFSFMIGFSVPNFILSYISANLWLRVLVFCGVILYLFVTAVYIFTILYLIFKKEKINVAMKSSRRQFTAHWKEFLKSMWGFFWRAAVVLTIIGLGLYVIPLALVNAITMPLFVSRFFKVFFTISFFIAVNVYFLLFCPFLAMKITVLYEYYEGLSATVIYPCRKYQKSAHVAGVAFLTMLLLVSTFCADQFDLVCPIQKSSGVVAHRAGGNMTTENTLAALEESIAYGATAAEIDVQRTKDGEYVICHDSDLEDLTGVSGDVKELTLEEIKTYRIKNTARPWEEGDEIPTLEEMLDAANGNIRLFIELKGKTADKQMVEDVYEMVKERDMLSQCVFICFSYDVISYIEGHHPEVDTGYLVYFSFGNLEDFNCDMLLVESECLSGSEIKRIHEAGKEVGVWTINTTSDLNLWLLSDVDYVVTDEVRGALALKRFLYNGNDEERILEAMILLM